MAAGDLHVLPYNSAEGTHSFFDVTRRLRDATDRVRSQVRVDTKSRVVRWLGALSKLVASDRRAVLAQMIPSLQADSWDHPCKDSFRALVESRLFVEIIEQLGSQLTLADLRDLVSGTYDPAMDRPSSRARDREFELFTAAVCKRAGLVVDLAEPDVLLRLDKSTHALAAKRLSSLGNVPHNIKRASLQIARAGLPGFIVLDVTRILDPGYAVVTHWRTARQTVGGPLLHFMNVDHRAALRKKRNDLVLGIALRAAFPHVSPGFQYGTYESWWAMPIDGVASSALNEFLKTILRGGQGC